MLEIKITPNKNWNMAAKYLRELPARLNWFQFEFSKIAAQLFLKILIDEVENIRNVPSSYRKRLAVAEIRDGSTRAWFAVVIKAQPISKLSVNLETTELSVVSRFPNLPGFDPVRDILQQYGPWTADMLPFVPSLKAAVVTTKTVPSSKVKEIRKANIKNMEIVGKIMGEKGIYIELRSEVLRQLHVVEDFEKIVEDWEFGNSPSRHPHWSKAVRKFQGAYLREILRNRSLVAAILDPKFKKYRVKTHLQQKMSAREVKELEKFQRRVLRKV